MLGYEDAKIRSDFLMVSIKVVQQDTQQFHDNFFKLCRDAKDTVEAGLKKAGLSSMEDLLQAALKELPEDKAKEYKKQVDDLRTKGLGDIKELLTHPTLKDMVDVGLWLGDFMAVTAAIHYANQIKKGFAAESKAFADLGPVYSRTIAMRALAKEASLLAEKAAQGGLTAAEFGATLAKFEAQTGKQIAANYDIQMIEKEAMEFAELSGQEAAQVATGASAAEKTAAEAAAGARGMIKGGIYGLLAAGVIMLAVYGLSKWEEQKVAEQLQGVIQHLATARLYANQDKLSAQAYCSLPSIIEDIADAYQDKDNVELEKKMNKFIDKSRKLLPSQDLKDTFAQLQKQDTDAKQKLDDDPDLDTMKKMHEEETKKSANKS